MLSKHTLFVPRPVTCSALSLVTHHHNSFDSRPRGIHSIACLCSAFSCNSETFPFTTMSQSKRVAIITGAAEGIGRGIATRLAKDGLDLGLFDLPRAQDRMEELAESLRNAYGVRVVTVYGDVSKEEDVENLVNVVVKELGSIYAVCDFVVISCAYAKVTMIADDRECWRMRQLRVARKYVSNTFLEHV